LADGESVAVSAAANGRDYPGMLAERNDRVQLMLRNGKRMSLATAALLLSGFSTSITWPENVTAPKRSADAQLQPQSSATTKPTMTADEQEKLKKELIKARDRQSQVKSNERAVPARAKKP
jgi:hypothetical protein